MLCRALPLPACLRHDITIFARFSDAATLFADDARRRHYFRLPYVDSARS